MVALDPRITPRPGDIVILRPEDPEWRLDWMDKGATFEVCGRAGRDILYCVGRFGYSCTLAEWRRKFKGRRSKIVRRGKRENHD